MSISSSKKSKDESVVVLSLEEYKFIVKEYSSDKKEYSKVGHLYPENNTPQYRWFKASINRGMRGDIPA